MFPKCHGAKWPADMINVDDPEVQDHAPEPGLTQCFPVVAPLSLKKLGPTDIRNPSEIIAQIEAKEAKDNAWGFQRERAKAALLREQQLAAGLHHRAGRAERVADNTAIQEAERIATLAQAAEARRKRGEDEIRAMRMKVREAQARKEEVDLQVKQCISEACSLLDAEKRHTAEVKDLLQRERQTSEVAWKRTADAEAESLARIQVRKSAVERADAEAEGRSSTAKRVADARVSEVRERCEAEVAAMRRQLEAARERCRERVEIEEDRFGQTKGHAQAQRDHASMRLGMDQHSMQHHGSLLAEDCKAHVQRVQLREDKTVMVVRHKMEEMAPQFEAAGQKSFESHRRDAHTTASLEQAVHVLGQHVSTRHQYGTSLDSKVSAILSGCLHARPIPGAPSPRSLPPPRHHGTPHS